MSGDGDRGRLNIPKLGDELADFAPRNPEGQGAGASVTRAIDAVSAFPSREPAPDWQLNLKGPRPILERFKAMCKADRRPYYDMLEILMDAFEKKR